MAAFRQQAQLEVEGFTVFDPQATVPQLLAQVQQALFASGLFVPAQVVNLEARPTGLRLPLLAAVGQEACLEHGVALDQLLDGRLQGLRRQALAVELLIEVAAHAAQGLFTGTPDKIGVLYRRQRKGLAVAHAWQRLRRERGLGRGRRLLQQGAPTLQRRLLVELAQGHVAPLAAQTVEPGHQVHRVQAQAQQVGVEGKLFDSQAQLSGDGFDQCCRGELRSGSGGCRRGCSGRCVHGETPSRQVLVPRRGGMRGSGVQVPVACQALLPPQVAIETAQSQ